MDKQDLRKTPKKPRQKLGNFLEQQRKLLNIPVSGPNGLGTYINNHSDIDIDISDGSLGHYHRARQWPSDRTRKAIASAFGFTLEQFDYFLDNEEVTEEEAKNYQENYQKSEDSISKESIRAIIDACKENPVLEEILVQETLKSFQNSYQISLLKQLTRQNDPQKVG